MIITTVLIAQERDEPYIRCINTRLHHCQNYTEDGREICFKDALLACKGYSGSP
jgi:hypothetical protein